MAASNVADDPRLRTGTAAAPAVDPSEGPEGATMTLVEHLEELRKRLFISLISIAVASVVAFFFWEPILRFLELPLPSLSNKLTGLDGQKLVATDIGEPFMVALKLAIAVGIIVA